MASNTLYASLFEAKITRIDLHDMPATPSTGSCYLNVLRHLDIPQAVALANERSQVILSTANKSQWNFAIETAAKLQWNKKLQLRDP